MHSCVVVSKRRKMPPRFDQRALGAKKRFQRLLPQRVVQTVREDQKGPFLRPVAPGRQWIKKPRRPRRR